MLLLQKKLRGIAREKACAVMLLEKNLPCISGRESLGCVTAPEKLCCIAGPENLRCIAAPEKAAARLLLEKKPALKFTQTKLRCKQMTLMLDSSWCYSYPEALRVGRAIEALGFEWFEDPLPVDDINGYVKLKQQLSVPLMATETQHGTALRTETNRAVSEKLAAVAEGVMSAQISVMQSALRFWPEILSGRVPSVLSGVAIERSMQAALKPASLRVKANYKRLSRG